MDGIALRFWYSCAMKSNWNYQDIIDLEYFLQRDVKVRTEELQKRDREIYLQQAKTNDEPGGLTEQTDPPALLKFWLDARRKTSPADTILPGNYAAEAHGLLRILLILLGLFIGSSAGFAFFGYSGSTPINVLNFLVVFVFSQLVMSLLLLSRGLFAKLGKRSAKLSNTLSFQFVATAVARLGGWLLRRNEQEMDAEKRLAMQAALGRIQATDSIYRGIFYWPLFLVVQLFGICFNFGLLAATMLKIAVSDIAFGWQSTLQFSAQSLYNFISWLALPWSWFLPAPIGHPGLSEIEGSRIVLKEGIVNLQTPDLVSWWPFLLLSVLFYGLFTRLLFYAWGKFSAQRAAKRLKFDTPSARQIVRRMKTPVVRTQAGPESDAFTATHAIEPADLEVPRQEPQDLQPTTLLLPDEIHDSCDRQQLAHILEQEGLTIADTHRFMADYEKDQQLLKKFHQSEWADSAGITIIQEAWMPPLVSFLSYLKEMRGAVGSLPITIRLTGKPDTTSIFTPVSDELSLKVWQQKLDTLGDPYMEIRPLIEE
ncbi:DUF2868 domain-containing protein [Desulfosediminicola ganghwensis]|uniref:DUF2868 domain-containing protein n=1 Tax=Desulfosediminicola ganghwensis TaxID=2569540 RepID=UPI0010ACEFE8|nr:DUF2868 domain-containing protein [Desulfosediminicola ganghwensis]